MKKEGEDYDDDDDDDYDESILFRHADTQLT